jgi:hypothetical protein
MAVAPDTLEIIQPGFYKIASVVSSSYFWVYKLAVFFVCWRFAKQSQDLH